MITIDSTRFAIFPLSSGQTVNRHPSHLNLDLESNEPPSQIHSEEAHPLFCDDFFSSRNWRAIFLDYYRIVYKSQELLGNPVGNNIQMQHRQHDLLIHQILLDGASPVQANHNLRKNVQRLLVKKCYSACQQKEQFLLLYSLHIFLLPSS